MSCMNREPLAVAGNARKATGMPTRIAPLTSGEWFASARTAGHFFNDRPGTTSPSVTQHLTKCRDETP